MAAGIQGKTACSAGFILSPQDLIDLPPFICFPTDLVIQIQDSRGSVLIPEVFMKDVDSRVDHRHQDTFSRKPIGPCLHRKKTGGRPRPVQGKKQPLWFFRIFNFGERDHSRHIPLRDPQDREIIEKICSRCIWKFCIQSTPQVPMVLHDDLPCPLLAVKAHIQLFCPLPHLLRDGKRQIQ